MKKGQKTKKQAGAAAAPQGENPKPASGVRGMTLAQLVELARQNRPFLRRNGNTTKPVQAKGKRDD